jgi:Uma2 family endonuclease
MAEAALNPAPIKMTVAEFLEWEDGTDTRYELVEGTPVAMAPALQTHGELVAAATIQIGTRLKAPCRLVSESGVRLPDRDDAFYVADFAITCAARVPGSRHANEPLVLVEVLSPSTAEHDRGRKAADYRSIPSVREIVMLFATAQRAEIWRRTDDGWFIEDVIGADASLRLTSVNVEVPLRAIYGDIPLDVSATRDAASA